MTRRRDALVVALPAALAAALCLYGLTARSLSFDEAATVAIVSQHGQALWRAIAHDGGNMAGYYLLLHLLIGWFGNGLLVLRLCSALAGAAAVGALSALALRLFDWRTALIAGLLAAVSLPLVFWAQNARGYALMLALQTGSFLAFVALVEDEHPDRRAWVAYVVCTTLAMYSSYTAVLAIPVQLLALCWRRQHTRRVIGALAAVAVCCVPLLVLALDRGSGQLFWVPRPNATSQHEALEALTSAGLEPSFGATTTTDLLLDLTAALLVIGAVAIVRGLVRRREAAWRGALVLGWAVLPVALAWIESLIAPPTFVPRNVLVALPAVSLLIAWVLVSVFRIRLLIVASCGALLALRALQLIPSYGTSPENWRGATGYVLARARASDCIAFYPSDGRMAFSYYLGTNPRAIAAAPRPILPATPWRKVRPFVEDYAGLSATELARLRSSCTRLWLVSSHVGMRHGPPASRVHVERFDTLLAELQRRYPQLGSARFGYADTIRVQLFGR